ncbi:EscU/YscU/HrcU family type III secretion system export apparatus switch protein [Noviherbaspirillum saxi]|uniref:EscU/YscU/HrcU family type III secretion system export apparatus switch protein n=1 Tax=Noviherbaspirillum saxi TaxID=2320863 RepID=A0A3A3FI26_9BURK|nr:EscU/YscU/HrcU family type III secretion system export apparatus switch protein [Noviherbaspirillum saxi]RJF92174.1 EscU/YscU/HrcU family type III secretion system export apparatus switch protein [Noviherbaspirillum saxi]
MAEKTKKPTAKKLRDAAEKGQVVHSPVVVRFVASIALLELIFATRNQWRPALETLTQRPFDVLGTASTATPGMLGEILMPVLAIAALISVVAAAFAATLGVAANIMQTGFVFSPKALPRYEGLNAVQNLMQMFQMDRLLELLLNMLKVTFIGGAAGFAVYASLDTLLHLADHTLDVAFDRLLDVVVYIERSSMAAIVVLVALDWMLKRKTFMKQMMMSTEDIKREHKDQDGDPHTKQHRKKISKEITLGDNASNTRKADVIVTNPTHFAVAIGFQHIGLPLPYVLARGKDEQALAMIKIAEKDGIPRVRYVWLARTLYSVGREGKPVPRVTLRAVAAVYRALYQLMEQKASQDEAIELGTDPEDPEPHPPSAPASTNE